MFLTEKYQIVMNVDQIVDVIHDLLEKGGSELAALPSLEDANKTLILRVKDRILAHPAPIPLPQSGSQHGPEIHDTYDEEDFFRKLQDLEQHRTLPPPPTPLNPLFTPSLPHGAGAAGAGGAAHGAGLGTGTSVVYLPSSLEPTRISKPIILNGCDRMWEYFTKRCTLIWSGPIPSNVSQLKLVCLLLPVHCAFKTPVIHIEVEGAAGNTIDVVCIRSSAGARAGAGGSGGVGGVGGSGGGDGAWDTWTPCADGFGELKSLSCPWTIKIKDAYGNPLDMGDDGFLVKASVKLLGGNTKLVFDQSGHPMSRGSTLLLRHSHGQDTRVKVIHYDDITCSAEVSGITHTAAAVGSKVFLMQAQATIVMSCLC